jgi:hypothetical protein
MRIIKQERGYFRGTHKGYEIEIQRDHYDGYCPAGITTLAGAKREAIYGACLDKQS